MADRLRGPVFYWKAETTQQAHWLESEKNSFGARTVKLNYTEQLVEIEMPKNGQRVAMSRVFL